MCDMDCDCRAIQARVVLCVGDSRDANWDFQFMKECGIAFDHAVQITSDGHRANAEARGGTFSMDVDYAMLLIKLYSASLALAPL